jgi:RNA polymerase sigma-70 factor, ECF subfamily
MRAGVNFVTSLNEDFCSATIPNKPGVGLCRDVVRFDRTISDGEICAKLQQSDESALRMLMDRHGAMVLRLAMNVLSDRQEAEDVAQEVFLSAWNNREAWVEKGVKYSTWIYRITINKAIDKRRQRRAVPESAETINSIIESKMTASNEADQEGALFQLEASEKLSGEIERLPAAQALALRMYYFESRDVAEIASLTDASEQAVRSLLKRARQALRMRLMKQKKTSIDDAFEIRRNPTAVRAGG